MEQIKTYDKKRQSKFVKHNGAKSSDKKQHYIKPKYKKQAKPIKRVEEPHKKVPLKPASHLYTKLIEMRNFITYDITKKRYRRAYMIYATKNSGSIVEFAGRMCYNSFSRITATSYEPFIAGIVKSGHESVIEHTNIIFIIPKPSDSRERHVVEKNMLEIAMYNGLLMIDELWPFYILSGNIRMFKDLYRKFKDITQYKTGKKNQIIDDILEEMYALPATFFADFIASDYMDEDKFVKLPTLPITTKRLEFRSTRSACVNIINDDKYDELKYSFIDHRTNKGCTLNVPKQIMNRHLRTSYVMRMPRYTSHQLVRHRLASYSQASQRYITEKNFEYEVPSSTQVDVTDNIVHFMEMERQLYEKLMVKYNLKAEDARCILSNNMMTQLVMTMTREETDHFIAMRANPHAQAFIREKIAKPMQEWINTNHK